MKRRSYRDTRRDATKKAGAALFGGLFGIGVLSEIIDQLVEVGDDVEDVVTGNEVDNVTDEIQLGPGDAAIYREDGEEKIIAYGPGELSIWYGSEGTVDELDLSQFEESEFSDGTYRNVDDVELVYDVDAVDAVNGGDVVEPRGPLSPVGFGMSFDDLRVKFDSEVGVIERGESEELLSNYTGVPQSEWKRKNY